MARRSLLTLAGLGALASAAGLVGVLAVGTDTATTGQNRAAAGEVTPPPPPPDALQLAVGDYDLAHGLVTCPAGDSSAYQPDLTSGLFDLAPGEETYRVLCVMNAATEPMGVELLVPDTTAYPVTNVELTCAPGEADVDINCFPGQVGELGDDVHISFTVLSCNGTNACMPRTDGSPLNPIHPVFRVDPIHGYEGSATMSVTAWRNTPIELSNPMTGLPAQDVFAVILRASATPDTTSQTDQVTWYFQLHTPVTNP